MATTGLSTTTISWTLISPREDFAEFRKSEAFLNFCNFAKNKNDC
jgi:hypothetical protein